MDHLVMWDTRNLDLKYQKTIADMAGFKIASDSKWDISAIFIDWIFKIDNAKISDL